MESAKSKDFEPKSPPPGAPQSRKIIDDLSDAERLRLRTAVNEIWNAEEVEKRREEMRAANLAYRQSLLDEIKKLEVTPKLRSVLIQLLHLRYKQEGKANDVAGGGSDRAPGRPKSRPLPYSDEEREIINAARVRAEKVPSVLEAKRKLDMAVTARERNVAAGGFRMVMRAAMEEADPRVKRIFGRRDRGETDRPRPNDRVSPGERRRPTDR